MTKEFTSANEFKLKGNQVTTDITQFDTLELVPNPFIGIEIGSITR